MNLPSVQECEQLLVQYAVPDNIVDHIKQVTLVALFIGKRLKEKGITVDLKLLERASLLHDLDKAMTLKNHHDHGKETARILADCGYDQVLSDTIMGHVVGDHDLATVKTWEQKILFYADKRVAHDKIVTVDERADEFLTRNKTLPVSQVERTRKDVKALEEQIFKHLDFEPSELIEEMHHA